MGPLFEASRMAAEHPLELACVMNVLHLADILELAYNS